MSHSDSIGSALRPTERRQGRPERGSSRGSRSTTRCPDLSALRHPVQLGEHSRRSPEVLLLASAATRERRREQRGRRRQGQLDRPRLRRQQRQIRFAQGLRLSALLLQRRQEGLAQSPHEDARRLSGTAATAASATESALGTDCRRANRRLQRLAQRGGREILPELRYQVYLSPLY